MLELPKIREEIDAIDREIVSLFERRMDLGAEVARYKMEAGKPVLDRDREQEKLKSVSAQAKDSFTMKTHILTPSGMRIQEIS